MRLFLCTDQLFERLFFFSFPLRENMRGVKRLTGCFHCRFGVVNRFKVSEVIDSYHAPSLTLSDTIFGCWISPIARRNNFRYVNCVIIALRLLPRNVEVVGGGGCCRKKEYGKSDQTKFARGNKRIKIEASKTTEGKRIETYHRDGS